MNNAAALNWTSHSDLPGYETACSRYRVSINAHGSFVLRYEGAELLVSDHLSMIWVRADIHHEATHGGPCAGVVRAANNILRELQAPAWSLGTDPEDVRQERLFRVGDACRIFSAALRASETDASACPLLEWARALSTAYASADSAGALYLWGELVGQGLIAGPPTEG